jgi:hypothetical protein
VVDILDVAGEIVVVADQVFPETPLPEIVLAAAVADERHTVARQRAREAGLVASPADWPYSTFRGCVSRGLYPVEWIGTGVRAMEVGEPGG